MTDSSITTGTPTSAPPFAKRLCLVALALVLWTGMRALFWVGYAGADDQFYSYYAYWFHRAPMNHMELRTAAILPIRACYALFGPSEFAAALPGLIGSLGLLGGTAWFVGWPRQLNWITTSSVILAAVMPIDVVFSTYPGALSISAGFLMFGTFAFIKGNWLVSLLGAVLLGLGFMAHELAFYYVAILCVSAVAIDWRRYWPRVLACVVASGLLFAAECAMFYRQTGDPLHRLSMAGHFAKGEGVVLDGRGDGSMFAFFTIPLKILVLCKDFGFDLVLLFVCGAAAWRRLDTQQRVLLASCGLYWFWLGYGTIVPWTYRPPTRGMHYYIALSTGIVALLPTVVALALGNWSRLARGVVGLAIVTHVASLSLGGSWGQRVDVSHALLGYAEAHPDQKFLTDVHTLNEMYLRNGFRMPHNVMALDSESLIGDLLVNKEPAGQKNFRFEPPDRFDGILDNQESIDVQPEPEFRHFLEQHRGQSLHRVPVRYRLALAPLVGILGPRDFMIRSRGGEVFAVKPDTTPALPRPVHE